MIGFLAVLLIALVVAAFVWEGSPLRSLLGGGGPEYIAYVDGDGNVAIILADGSKDAILTDDGDQVRYGPLAWSPDHGSIAAYRVDPDTEEHSVWIGGADGQGSQTIVIEADLADCEEHQSCMAWSPDGKRIALVGYDKDWENSRVVVADVKTGKAETIAEEDQQAFFTVSWMSDGDRVAVTAADKYELTGYIEVMRADGSDAGQMTLEEEDDLTGLALIAPKGGKMAYVTYNASSDRYRLYLAKSDGTEVERIARTEYYLAPLDWSRDGSRLLYYSDEDEALLVYDVRSGDEIKVVDSEGDFDPNNFAALSPDGKSVIYYNHDYEIILFDLETEDDSRLAKDAEYFLDW